MDADIVYSILISSTWCFLGGWVLLLSLTSAMVFRHDLLSDMPTESRAECDGPNLTKPCRGNT
jgi:hypothetical protein